MKITWIGHSCFKIEENGFTVVFDPYEDDTVPGLNPVRERANLVLCTHEHSDHNYRAGVVIEKSGENPFVIHEMETYHDEAQGAKCGTNRIYILDDGKTKIAHLGDLGCELTSEQKEQLKNLDILFVPVGGFYTINGTQAAALVKELEPHLTIPMHFRNDEKGFGYQEISMLGEFLMNTDCKTTFENDSIELSTGTEQEIIVMMPANTKI